MPNANKYIQSLGRFDAVAIQIFNSCTVCADFTTTIFNPISLLNIPNTPYSSSNEVLFGDVFNIA